MIAKSDNIGIGHLGDIAVRSSSKKLEKVANLALIIGERAGLHLVFFPIDPFSRVFADGGGREFAPGKFVVQIGDDFANP